MGGGTQVEGHPHLVLAVLWVESEGIFEKKEGKLVIMLCHVWIKSVGSLVNKRTQFGEKLTLQFHKAYAKCV